MDQSSSESSDSFPSESDSSSDIPSDIEFEISSPSPLSYWAPESESSDNFDSESDILSLSFSSPASFTSEPEEQILNMEIVLNETGNETVSVEVNSTDRTNNDDVEIVCPNDISVIDLSESPTSTPVPRRRRRGQRFPRPFEINDSNVEIIGDPSIIPLPITIDESPPNNRATNNENNQNAASLQINTDQNERRRNRKKRASPYSSPTNRLSHNSSTSSNDSSKFSCPICFESLIGNNPMSTLCGHIFCQTCIMKVLKETKCCPVCKKKLNLNHVHKIFI